ncbi:MAG: FAD-binding protein [Chloroflexi bacterium]|nr:FAD-binding protein [Chloroflexota bacterium]
MPSNSKASTVADVVVAGYGLAGAIAAVEAHDAGASVIILEKSCYPGGCSMLAAGMIVCAGEVEAAVQYLTKTSGGRTSPEVIRAFAGEMALNEDYLRRLALTDNARVMTVAGAKDSERKRVGAYPFPGYENFYQIRVAEVPGFAGFPWVATSKPAGPNLMKLAFDNVESRGIKVLLSTPARKLATANGVITGVIAGLDGQETVITARRAVVLASGGFEQNEWMRTQYLQGKPFYSMAPLTHTGDGVLMAQQVGAALWHMWHVHGSYGFKFPEFPIAFRHSFSGIRNPKRVMPWIVVDKSGRRYMNEYPLAPQDTAHRPMEIFDPDFLGYPRIPSYIIFDEVGRSRGAIGAPLSIGEMRYDWSKDNLQEGHRGWIMRADSIRELGQKIRETADNEARMEPEALEATMSAWNDAVTRGEDPFHRLLGTMMPIEQPPFYAAPVWPVITNTQGGPEHDARQQVIDVFGQPIPHLYAAGELGSFWSHVYLLSGNLSECLTSGRVAGRNAAREPYASAAG